MGKSLVHVYVAEYTRELSCEQQGLRNNDQMSQSYTMTRANWKRSFDEAKLIADGTPKYILFTILFEFQWYCNNTTSPPN